MNLLKRIMRIMVYFLLFCALMVFTAFALNRLVPLLPDNPSPALKKLKVEKPEVTPEFSATRLVSDYYENEVRADSLYKGKVALITGNVVSVEKMPFRIHLMLRLEGTDAGTVNCYLKSGQREAAALLNAGERVTIKGKIEGKDSRGVKVMPAELFASEYIRKWGRNRRSGSFDSNNKIWYDCVGFRRRVLAPSHDGVFHIQLTRA